MVCALQEMASLILALGTTATNLLTDQTNSKFAMQLSTINLYFYYLIFFYFLDLLECILSVLLHPCQAARLAAAWCLRCVCVAIPSQITPLIDRLISSIRRLISIVFDIFFYHKIYFRCVDGLENMRTSPEAIAGYSGALAAVLGGVRLSPLGVPHTKGKVWILFLFSTAIASLTLVVCKGYPYFPC